MKNLNSEVLYESRSKNKTGKVQYIHPKKRFVVLEFTLNTCLGVRKYKQAHQLVNGQLFN